MRARERRKERNVMDVMSSWIDGQLIRFRGKGHRNWGMRKWGTYSAHSTFLWSFWWRRGTDLRYGRAGWR